MDPGKATQKKPKQNLFEKYHAQYDFDPAKVTLETEVPAGPKKAKKPSKPDLIRKEQALRAKIAKLRERKEGLFAKPGERVRSAGPEDAFEAFSERLEDLRELKQAKRTRFEDLNEQKMLIDDLT